MIDLTSLTNTVLTLFTVVIVSFVATKAKLITESFTKGFSTFIICVAQPFMIMSALSEVEFSVENLIGGFTVTGIGFILMAVSAGIAFISTTRFKDADEKKIGQFALIFGNTGFMGIPVLESAFGKIGAFYGAFFVITFHITLWTYGMILLAKGRTDIKVKPLNMLVNYGTIPVLIGIILYILPFKMPIPVSKAMSVLSSMCAPGSMIIVGNIIAGITVKELLLDYKVYFLCVVKLIVTPLIVCLTAVLTGLKEEYVYLFTILSALPSATNTAMYATLYDIAPKFGAKLCSISTVISVATVPIVIYLAKFILSL